MKQSENSKEEAVKSFTADHIALHKDANVSTLIIREGAAPKLLDEVRPVGLFLEGTISSPFTFWEKRKNLHDQNQCHIVYNKNAGTITLKTDERFPNENYTIVGKIIENPDLDNFKINKNVKFQVKQLMEVLKFNRMFFNDTEENFKIVAALQNFKAKAEKTFAEINDNRGNEEVSKITKLEHDLQEKFVLRIPLFKGQSPSLFSVDICVTATSSSVEIWLQSVELKELFEKAKEAIP